MFLAPVGTPLQRVKLEKHPNLLNMIATADNYSATALTAKIGRNIRMFTDTFTDNDHYLSAAANFPNMPPETIKDARNRK